MSRVSPDLSVVPFNHKFSTLERAVKERVFRVKTDGEFMSPPRPTVDFAAKMENFKASLRPFLPSTAPLTYQQFVDTYKGRKREVYVKALDDLRSGAYTLQEDSAVKVFIKCEKTDRTSKIDPVPRVISPRNTRYNLRVGRYLKHLEKPIFKAIDRLFDHPTVIKGYSYDESARLLKEKWEMFRDPVAIGLDASRFDQHVSIDALKFEHSIYPECFYAKKHASKLRKLLKYQLVNHCTGYAPDGSLKYVVEGTRMSGDMNTSLGNCILMCGMIWSYLQERGVVGSLANNGDDCVVFMERADLGKFSRGLREWFLTLGFNMTVEEPVFEFEHLEFCQTKPVFDGVIYTMCRNPITAIAKDSVMLNPWQGESHFRGWLDSVGTGGMSIAGGLPVFQSLYHLFVRSGKKRRVSEHLLPWSVRCGNSNRVFMPVTAEARASFWAAYDITPCEQICLEKYYDSMFIGGTLGAYAPRDIFV